MNDIIEVGPLVPANKPVESREELLEKLTTQERTFYKNLFEVGPEEAFKLTKLKRKEGQTAEMAALELLTSDNISELVARDFANIDSEPRKQVILAKVIKLLLLRATFNITDLLDDNGEVDPGEWEQGDPRGYIVDGIEYNNKGDRIVKLANREKNLQDLLKLIHAKDGDIVSPIQINIGEFRL